MTEQEINVAIAEACGYTKQGGLWIKPDGGRVGSYGRECDLHSYCTDLNEVHKAERTLTIENFAKYENELCKVVDASGTDSDIWFYVLTATARQRAEAFLRTIGKWKDA